VPDTPGVGVRSVRMGAVQEERCSGVASSYILGGPGAELKSAVLVEWVCWVPGSLVGAAMCWEVVDTDGRMNQLTLWQCTLWVCCPSCEGCTNREENPGAKRATSDKTAY